MDGKNIRVEINPPIRKEIGVIMKIQLEVVTKLWTALGEGEVTHLLERDGVSLALVKCPCDTTLTVDQNGKQNPKNCHPLVFPNLQACCDYWFAVKAGLINLDGSIPNFENVLH